MTHSVPYTKDHLVNLRPAHDSFIGVDSDGCVFDTMEIKQKQCFHGLVVRHFGLEPIEPLVRETLEFVNLYSQWRGTNRFIALVRSFEMLRGRPEVRASGVPIPELASFIAWTRNSPSLGNPDLENAAKLSGDPELASVLAWSKAVNAEIAAKVVDAPPFRWARRGLLKIHAHSDAICVSQTPTEALVREWTASGIIGMVSFIAGQELGTKAEHIALATRGKYFPDRIMMIGDALGDKEAARANDALFYPINPSREEASWERFCEEAFDRFLNGTYAGDYADRLIADFDRLLPREPTWQQ